MSTRKKYLKILVSGPYASGKTTFVKTLCGRILTTEARVSTPGEAKVKETTTVAFDYGKTTVDGMPVYLFGTPGQTRFQFMWKILAYGIHGYIYMVDTSSVQEVLRARALYSYMKSIGNYPHIIAANKQDLEHAVPPSTVARLFNVSPLYVVPLIALKRESAMSVLKYAIKVISRGAEPKKALEAGSA